MILFVCALRLVSPSLVEPINGRKWWSGFVRRETRKNTLKRTRKKGKLTAGNQIIIEKWTRGKSSDLVWSVSFDLSDIGGYLERSSQHRCMVHRNTQPTHHDHSTRGRWRDKVEDSITPGVSFWCRDQDANKESWHMFRSNISRWTRIISDVSL